jgi:hypothetical protein
MNFHDEYLQRCSEWSDIVDHLPRLHAETARYTAPQVVELGVRSGNSTCAFLAAVETVGGLVWSVDPERAHVPPHWFDSDLWTFVQADDLKVVDEAPPCDVLFIDTTHGYQQTWFCCMTLNSSALRRRPPATRPSRLRWLSGSSLRRTI